MKNNLFNGLLDIFKSNFKKASDATDLQDLKEKYIALEVSRDNVFDWIIENNPEEQDKYEYMSKFGKFESSLWETDNSQELIVGIPIFDLDISFDEIDQMFDDYGSYFQRYGCLSSDQIISWDKENVLFDDEFGNVEIVKRPDVLLNIQ